MNVCSPNVTIQDNYTCFDYYELAQIAKAYNSYIKRKELCDKNMCAVREKIAITNQSKRELWNSIYKVLNTICDNEYCWIQLDFMSDIPDQSVRNKLQLFTFKPQTTPKLRSWLNTQDINNVLQQYQELDPSFYYLGALPSDFYLHVPFNFKKLKSRKIKSIGIVLNHDKHNQPGSHWVALFVDVQNKMIEYFDSTGGKPNKNIWNFIKFLNNRVFNSKFVYKENKHKHQYENYACGIYSIFFIVQRLLGRTFDDITNNIIKDDEITKYKQHLFRPRM